MPLLEAPTLRPLGEHELRRLIDLSVGRALFDKQFRSDLLADPTLALGGKGCAPQQYVELGAIRACDLQDFAERAQAVFWPAVRSPWVVPHRAIAASQ